MCRIINNAVDTPNYSTSKIYNISHDLLWTIGYFVVAVAATSLPRSNLLPSHYNSTIRRNQTTLFRWCLAYLIRRRQNNQ